MASVYTVDHTPGGTPVYSCACGKEWLKYYNLMAIKRGIVKSKIDVMQGGYRNGATAASAGTHNGGGAFDFAQYSDEAIKLAREMGSASWHRYTWQGFSPHHHAILIGCPHHPGADYQVEAYKDGYDGLGNGWKRKDDGARVSPIRTWSQGVAWAKQQLGEGDDLTSKEADAIRAQMRENQSQLHHDIGVVQNQIKGLSTVKNPANSKNWKIRDALWSIWYYTYENYKMLKDQKGGK